eukprot:gene10121-12413_t
MHRENLKEIRQLQRSNESVVELPQTLLEFFDQEGNMVNINSSNETVIDEDLVRNNNSKLEEKLGGEYQTDDDDDDNLFSEEEKMELVARSFIYKHIQEKKTSGVDPVEFTREIGFKLELEEEDDAWKIITAFLTKKNIAVNLFLNYLKYNSLSRPYRKKLPNINNFEDVIELFSKSNNIVIITGAGVSVSCGIPDFRSKGGVYDIIEKKYDLPQPESLFDINYLKTDPRPFFEFAKEIYPGAYKPSPTHNFIRKLEEKGKLLRNYTQNIDTLEHLAGITEEKLVNCHGSFKTATCIKCKTTVDGVSIRESIMKTEIPICTICNDNTSFMKPDIVFFGETLPERFDQCVNSDLKKIDLLIIMGSSLQVQPVALFPDIVDKKIPQILVNREVVGQPHEFDYVYLGDCDNFVKELQSRIGWV